MRKKRISALIAAVLLLFIFSFNCFAVLGNHNYDDPDEGISYADTQNEGATAINKNEREKKYEHGISAETAEKLNKLIYFWNDYGLMTIFIVLAVIVVITVIVSVNEKKKLRAAIKEHEEEQQNS